MRELENERIRKRDNHSINFIILKYYFNNIIKIIFNLVLKLN